MSFQNRIQPFFAFFAIFAVKGRFRTSKTFGVAGPAPLCR
jgi:hypothetical protein